MSDDGAGDFHQLAGGGLVRSRFVPMDAMRALESPQVQATMRLGCPFCSALDFIVADRANLDAEAGKVHTCATCKRSARFDVIKLEGATRFLARVTDGGPVPPAWNTL